jgi:uncharacterized membrane protein
MPRIVAIFVAIALAVYAVIDCLQTREPKTLPRVVWLLIIVGLPMVGPVMWLLFGRANRSGSTQKRGPIGPDDDPSWLRKLPRR